MPIDIDNTDVSEITIDGQEVSEITADGNVVFTAVPDIPDSAVPDSGVSHWSMNNTNDDSSVLVDEWSGYNGSVAQGQATFISGGGQRGDGAFEFDGDNDGFEIPSTSIPDGNDSFSIHVEFNADDPNLSYDNAGQGLIGRNTVFGSGMVVENGELRALADNRSSEVTHPISSNTDYIATMVLDDSNSQLELYVDGSQVGADSWNGNFGQDKQYGIGDMQPNDSSEGFFDGVIGLIKTYGKSLNSTEVSNLYNNGEI